MTQTKSNTQIIINLSGGIGIEGNILENQDIFIDKLISILKNRKPIISSCYENINKTPVFGTSANVISMSISNEKFIEIIV